VDRCVVLPPTDAFPLHLLCRYPFPVLSCPSFCFLYSSPIVLCPMQSFRALLDGGYGSASHAPASEGLGLPADIKLTPQQSKELQFRRYNGLARRYLNLFPKNMRVFAGTATLVAGGFGLFYSVRPSQYNHQRIGGICEIDREIDAGCSVTQSARARTCSLAFLPVAVCVSASCLFQSLSIFRLFVRWIECSSIVFVVFCCVSVVRSFVLFVCALRLPSCVCFCAQLPPLAGPALRSGKQPRRNTSNRSASRPLTRRAVKQITLG
jgi:hypothetical protein